MSSRSFSSAASRCPPRSNGLGSTRAERTSGRRKRLSSVLVSRTPRGDEDDEDGEGGEDPRFESDEDRRAREDAFAAEHDPEQHDLSAGEEFRQAGDWTADDGKLTADDMSAVQADQEFWIGKRLVAAYADITLEDADAQRVIDAVRRALGR